MNCSLCRFFRKNARQSSKQRSAGFTLIELMIVAAILVMLAGIAVPQLLKSFEETRLQKLEIDAQQVLGAMNRAVLADRMKGSTPADLSISLSSDVLSEVYSVELTEVGEATFSYSYVDSTSKSYVTVTYNGKTYRTDQAPDGWIS